MPAKDHPARRFVGLLNDGDLSAILDAARIGLSDEDIRLSVSMGQCVPGPRMDAMIELLGQYAERNRRKDGVPTNADRANTARKTLAAYATIKNGPDGAPEDADDVIDLIADLFHAFGRDRMADAIRLAEGHYQYELNEILESETECAHCGRLCEVGQSECGDDDCPRHGKDEGSEDQ